MAHHLSSVLYVYIMNMMGAEIIIVQLGGNCENMKNKIVLLLKYLLSCIMGVAVFMNISMNITPLLDIHVPHLVFDYCKANAEQINYSIPIDAIVYNGHYYKYFADRCSWQRANKKCHEYGGYLVTIKDAKENDFILSMMKDYTSDSYAWIGFSDLDQEGKWCWANNEKVTYTNWGTSQPDAGTLQNCAILATKYDSGYSFGHSWSCNEGEWDNVQGSFPFGFICEWDETIDDNVIQYLSEIQPISYERYTGNEGDSCVFNFDRLGLPGANYEYLRNGNIDINGKKYQNGFEIWIARWNNKPEKSWVRTVYPLYGRYSKLTGRTGLIKGSYNTKDFNATIYFMNGKQVLFQCNMTPKNIYHNIKVDLTGVKELTLYVIDNEAKAGGTSFALAELKLN